MEKIYTLQIDGHGNLIICGDTRERSGYHTIKSGTYKECGEAAVPMAMQFFESKAAAAEKAASYRQSR